MGTGPARQQICTIQASSLPGLQVIAELTGVQLMGPGSKGWQAAPDEAAASGF